MKPKFFLFIGIAMIAVSLIIIFVFIANPSTSLARMVSEQPQYQKCIDDFTKINDMDGDNKLNETERLSVTTICDIMHTDYDRTDTTTMLLAAIGGLLLILGILQTIISATWLTVAKVRERRRNKNKRFRYPLQHLLYISLFLGGGVVMVYTPHHLSNTS